MEGDILVLQLRQHGQTFLDPKITPAEFTTELLYECILSSLEGLGMLTAAERRKKFPKTLPAAVAARFGIAQTLVTALTEAGLPASAGFGYDSIVYPAEASTKAVLNWLIGELGKASERAAQEAAAAEGHDDDAQGTSVVTRGVLQLQRAVEAALGTHVFQSDAASKKAAATANLRLHVVSLRRRAKRTVDGGSPPTLDAATNRTKAYLSLGALCPAWEQPEGEEDAAGVVPMLEHAGAWYSANCKKVHRFEGEPPVPEWTQVATQTINESYATQVWSTKGFQRLVAAVEASMSPELTSANSHDDQADGSALQVQGVPHQANPITVTHDAIISSFYCSAEAGLSDGAVLLAQKKIAAQNAEAEVSAAAAAIEETQRVVEDKATQREREAKDVKHRLNQAKRSLRERLDAASTLEANIEAANKQLALLVEQQAADEAAVMSKHAAALMLQQRLSLLDDPEASETKIALRIQALKDQRKAIKDDGTTKLLKVEKKREQLLEQHAAQGSERDSELAEVRNDVKAIKKKLKDRAREVKSLMVDYEKCPKEIDRSSFLRLIFDMTANIRKQQHQLEKVKGEIHALQADATKLEALIASLFSSIEERVYATAAGSSGTTAGTAAAAKTKDERLVGVDDFGRQAYRNLVDLQESYAALVSTIQQRGTARQELHELEEKSGKLKRLVGTYDVQKMARDLDALREENLRLLSEVEEGGEACEEA